MLLKKALQKRDVDELLLPITDNRAFRDAKLWDLVVSPPRCIG